MLFPMIENESIAVYKADGSISFGLKLDNIKQGLIDCFISGQSFFENVQSTDRRSIVSFYFWHKEQSGQPSSSTQNVV